MFKLNSKIDNVVDYVIHKNKPYYINTSDEIQCGEKKQMLYSTPLNSMVVFNNRFYFSEWEDNYKIFDENLELIEKGKDKVFYKLSNFYIAYDQDENNTILIDKKDNLIEFEYIDRSSISVFSNEYIYIYIMIKHLLEPFLFKRKSIYGSFLLLHLGSGKIRGMKKEISRYINL